MNADQGTVNLVVHEPTKSGRVKPNEAHVIDADGKTVLDCFRVGAQVMQRKVKKFSHVRTNKAGEEVEVWRSHWVDVTDTWPALPSWVRRGVMDTLGLSVKF